MSLYNVQCTLYIVRLQCTNVHCTLYVCVHVQCTMYIVHCTVTLCYYVNTKIISKAITLLRRKFWKDAATFEKNTISARNVRPGLFSICIAWHGLEKMRCLGRHILCKVCTVILWGIYLSKSFVMLIIMISWRKLQKNTNNNGFHSKNTFYAKNLIFPKNPIFPQKREETGKTRKSRFSCNQFLNGFNYQLINSHSVIFAYCSCRRISLVKLYISLIYFHPLHHKDNTRY